MKVNILLLSILFLFLPQVNFSQDYLSSGVYVIKRDARLYELPAFLSNSKKCLKKGSKIQVLDHSGFFAKVAFNEDKGYVNPFILDVSSFEKITPVFLMKESIRKEYANWLLKKEFEKTSEYQKRISPASRKKQLQILSENGYEKYKQAYINRELQHTAVLGDYDADNERFRVTFKNHVTYLKVPLSEASYFKKEFRFFLFGEFDVELDKSNQWVLNHYTIAYRNRKKHYSYSINDYYKPEAPSNFVVEVGDIEIPELNLSKQKMVVQEKSYQKSDVNVDIPQTSKVNSNTFFLIIGNEDYSTRQKSVNTESNVPYAADDAKYLSVYANKTLGVPVKNISLLINATKSEIMQEMDKFSELSKLKNGEAKIVFYFAGHGLPDEETKEQYIIPVDVNGVNLKYAIKLNEIISTFSNCNAQQVTILLDACFSGGGRNNGLLAARGVKIKPKEAVVKGNLVVFASSSASESSFSYDEKQHGIFTYFILKKLQETKGKVDYSTLFDYVKREVEFNSVLINSKKQTPNVRVSPTVYNEWSKWRFL